MNNLTLDQFLNTMNKKLNSFCLWYDKQMRIEGNEEVFPKSMSLGDWGEQLDMFNEKEN